jgi:uncharacterized membrane protein
MDNHILLLPILTGSIFILAAAIMLKFPPKKINNIYGYRTPSSMKNQERWDFSQKYSAKKLIKLGGILSLCSLIGLVYKPTKNIETYIGLVLLILTAGILILRVEMAIKRKFGNKI